MFDNKRQDELLIQKYFYENYWKEFEERLASKTSREERLDIYELELSLQQNKLLQYQKQYEQEPYTNNSILLSQQIELYNELKRRFYEEFPTTLGSNIKPLKINYGERNEEVVEILYQGLYPEFIEVEKEVFYQHFFGETTEPIRWKVAESSFVYLFKKIKLETFNEWECLSEHFTNKKGNIFNPKQLSNVSTKQTYQNKVSYKECIDDILEKINL